MSLSSTLHSSARALEMLHEMLEFQQAGPVSAVLIGGDTSRALRVALLGFDAHDLEFISPTADGILVVRRENEQTAQIWAERVRLHHPTPLSVGVASGSSAIGMLAAASAALRKAKSLGGQLTIAATTLFDIENQRAA